MGLGPPVCERCLVFYRFRRATGWECPICETTSPYHLNLWSMMSEGQSLDELVQELDANQRFLEFMRGPPGCKDE